MASQVELGRDMPVECVRCCWHGMLSEAIIRMDDFARCPRCEGIEFEFEPGPGSAGPGMVQDGAGI